MPPVAVGIPTYTFIGTLGADASACQTYPPIVASSGNTFIFPYPLNLGSYFINAKYMVEVAYNDAPVDRGLIAAADLHNTTSIAYYSFTVAMVRACPVKTSHFCIYVILISANLSLYQQ
jgi:hypothetical protein